MQTRAALLLVCGLSACAPAAAPPASPPHDPQRIVSLNPCTDAILTQLVEPGRIAAISAYSQDPQASSMDVGEARRFDSVGGTAEEVIALKPDLVVTGAHLSPATRNALDRQGIAVQVFGVPATIAESRQQIADMAQALDAPERGRALLARIDAALAAAQSDAKTPALVWLGDGLVPGQGTLVGDVMNHSGFRNASADYGLASWDVLPSEYVVAHPPRVVFMDRRGSSAASGSREDGARRRRIDALQASGQRVQIEDFPQNLLYCGGPTLIPLAKRFAQARQGLR